MKKAELIKDLINKKRNLEEYKVSVAGKKPLITKIDSILTFLGRHKVDDQICDLYFKEIDPLYKDMIERCDDRVKQQSEAMHGR